MAITKLQPFNLDTTANYTFANVTASNINGANLVSANYVTGTLTTATQPNITSTGTLANLTVSGNVALSGANVSLGAVGNLKITGGTANYVLQTDGAGNLSWTTGGGTGFLYVYTRSGPPVTVDILSGYLNIVGRSGVIPIAIS